LLHKGQRDSGDEEWKNIYVFPKLQVELS
jgi:hypothetical protein